MSVFFLSHPTTPTIIHTYSESTKIIFLELKTSGTLLDWCNPSRSSIFYFIPIYYNWSQRKFLTNYSKKSYQIKNLLIEPFSIEAQGVEKMLVERTQNNKKC